MEVPYVDSDKKSILLVNTTITDVRQVYRNSECIHIAYNYIPCNSSDQIKSNCVHVNKTTMDTYHAFKLLISNIKHFSI